MSFKPNLLVYKLIHVLFAAVNCDVQLEAHFRSKRDLSVVEGSTNSSLFVLAKQSQKFKMDGWDVIDSSTGQWAGTQHRSNLLDVSCDLAAF